MRQAGGHLLDGGHQVWPIARVGQVTVIKPRLRSKQGLTCYLLGINHFLSFSFYDYFRGRHLEIQIQHKLVQS